MYHLKDDKRSLYTSELLYEALLDRLEREELSAVKVTRLVEQAEVGRSTFYRNFDEPVDLLRWKCDLGFEELISSYNDKRGDGSDLLAFIFSYWKERSAILLALFKA